MKEPPVVTCSHTSLTLFRITRLFHPNCQAEGYLPHSISWRGGELQPRGCRYLSLHPVRAEAGARLMSQQNQPL
jgi:hypothetical protein